MPVRIRAREGLEVETDLGEAEGARDDKKSAMPAQKLRELLAVLVARPRGATHAELIDWLWPDAEGDKAQSSLKVATHRLRQWLCADAVKVDGGRTRLDPSVVACDVWGAVPSEQSEEVLAGFELPPVLALRRRLKAGMRA